jgi:hypothetical protein
MERWTSKDGSDFRCTNIGECPWQTGGNGASAGIATDFGAGKINDGPATRGTQTLASLLRDVNGNAAGHIDGENLRDINGNWVGNIRNNKLFDTGGSFTGEFRGDKLYDADGNFQGEMRGKHFYDKDGNHQYTVE